MMFLRNKFLLFLLACTIANPCFGDECSGTTLFCPGDSGQLILNQTQWNIFSDKIDLLNTYINDSANAFNTLLNDENAYSIQARIKDLYDTKVELDKLINDPASTTSLVSGFTKLGLSLETLSSKVGILEGLAGDDGGFKLIINDLSDTSQELDKKLAEWKEFQVRPIVLRLGCAEGYYVAKCGDINIDLNTILGYVNEYYNIEDSSCWNQDKPYEEMRYLLHLDNDDNATYTKDNSAFRDHFTECGSISNNESGLYKLQELRKNIFDTCISSSYVCKKCPNDGITDVKTELILAQSATYNTDGSLKTDAVPAHWNSFNTIADCFTLGGSDAKGTFKLETPYNYNSTTHKATGDKCHYEYYSE